jgi:hypothetical protein
MAGCPRFDGNPVDHKLSTHRRENLNVTNVVSEVVWQQFRHQNANEGSSAKEEREREMWFHFNRLLKNNKERV